MEAIPSFGEEKNFKLTRAILLYEHRDLYQGGHGCAATIHEVELHRGKPTIQPGAPVTVDALEALATSLGEGMENCLLPERVLAVSLARTVWWCPGARRRIWFSPADKGPTGIALKKLNGKTVAHPPLLFCGGKRGLRLFALADNRRPTLDTKLFRAPYYNIDTAGHMCAGTARLPDGAGPSLITKFERAFFDSSFSHSNWGHQLTRHPKAHLGLWQEMLRAKTFPAKYLLPTQTTVKSLLNSRYDD